MTGKISDEKGFDNKVGKEILYFFLIEFRYLTLDYAIIVMLVQ